MTVSDHEILGVARKITVTADCEADYRAIVGRAYYSAYHHSLGFHASLDAPGSEPPADVGGVHARLIHRLTHPSTKNNALNISSRQIGYMLRTMKFERGRADYELTDTLLSGDAQQSIELADRLFSVG